MNTGKDAAIHCVVERSDKLPPELSADALCAAVRRAATPALERSGLNPTALSVRITVDSDTKLSAFATLNGKILPDHHVGIADRALNERAVDMLATAIAADVTSGRP